jgi:hypothetical protein
MDLFVGVLRCPSSKILSTNASVGCHLNITARWLTPFSGFSEACCGPPKMTWDKNRQTCGMGLKLPDIFGIPVEMWKSVYWINWLPHLEQSELTLPYLIVPTIEVGCGR